MCFLLCLGSSQFARGAAVTTPRQHEKRRATLWIFFSKKPERWGFFSWFPLVSYFGFALKVCGGGTGGFWLVCGVYLSLDAVSLRCCRCWHRSWCLCQGKCWMMELVKVPLQRGGQKAAEICSLHCTGLTRKPLARISMPQIFKLWSCHWRAKGGRVWQPARAQQVEME